MLASMDLTGHVQWDQVIDIGGRVYRVILVDVIKRQVELVELDPTNGKPT